MEDENIDYKEQYKRKTIEWNELNNKVKEIEVKHKQELYSKDKYIEQVLNEKHEIEKGYSEIKSKLDNLEPFTLKIINYISKENLIEIIRYYMDRNSDLEKKCEKLQKEIDDLQSYDYNDYEDDD